MPYTFHEHIKPISDRITIWRFMKYERFKELVATGKLYFSKVGAFEDVFEGRWPVANEKLRPEAYAGLPMPTKEAYDAIEKIAREECFASCFHMNRYESAFMWNLYSDRDRGVAIKTTSGRLKRALKPADRSIYISKIEYIDYNRQPIDEVNIMYLSLHKRKSFEAERELRALILDRQSHGQKGIKVDVDLRELLFEVYISPYAGKEELLETTELMYDNGLKGVKVAASDLYTLR